MGIKFTSKEKLFSDLVWENYKTRIKYLFHKIHTLPMKPDHKSGNVCHLLTTTIVQPEVRYDYPTRDAEFNNSFFLCNLNIFEFNSSW